jgi:hypothetical protein
MTALAKNKNMLLATTNMSKLVFIKPKANQPAQAVNLLFKSSFHTSNADESPNRGPHFDKERFSKPRSQIKGVELLRNPSLYKV